MLLRLYTSLSVIDPASTYHSWPDVKTPKKKSYAQVKGSVATIRLLLATSLRDVFVILDASRTPAVSKSECTGLGHG